jgi:hypothetical protein
MFLINSLSFKHAKSTQCVCFTLAECAISTENNQIDWNSYRVQVEKRQEWNAFPSFSILGRLSAPLIHSLDGKKNPPVGVNPCLVRVLKYQLGSSPEIAYCEREREKLWSGVTPGSSKQTKGALEIEARHPPTYLPIPPLSNNVFDVTWKYVLKPRRRAGGEKITDRTEKVWVNAQPQTVDLIFSTRGIIIL